MGLKSQTMRPTLSRPFIMPTVDIWQRQNILSGILEVPPWTVRVNPARAPLKRWKNTISSFEKAPMSIALDIESW